MRHYKPYKVVGREVIIRELAVEIYSWHDICMSSALGKEAFDAITVVSRDEMITLNRQIVNYIPRAEFNGRRQDRRSA